jgi:predicted alpha/beta hydrolase
VAPLTLVASDGFPLAATRFRATGDAKGVVVIAAATGARQRYYQPFARFLAEQGFDVITWDWRGTGDSRYEARSTDRRLTMRNWGERDLESALSWARARAAGRPLLFVGHSFGGQALGLAPSAAAVSRAVFVGAQHGYYGHWEWQQRWALAALWRVLMPATAMVLGRFPSSRLGFGEDLPRGVACEWARWCRAREHLGTWDRHAELAIPILAYSFADDWIAPCRAADALLAQYPGSSCVHRHLRPADVGAHAIGHFGFFRPGVVPALWSELADFLFHQRWPAG